VRLRAAEVAAAVEGTWEGPDVEIDGASIDSRTLRGGELFVPVRGERDGHDFISAAVDAGAAAYLTARRDSSPAADGVAAIRVADTEAALLLLGSWARGRLTDRVVGVTGSAGKTTTKELLAQALATTYRTAASERSFNNELGVPLTLVNASVDTEALVAEMGARGQGDIRLLCDIARPSVGVVTNVSAAHTAIFGSVDNVAVAKGELVEALPADGIAVLNADDVRVAAMASRTAARVLMFGDEGDVQAIDVRIDDGLRASFVLRSPWGDARVRLAALGRHQVANALAAATTALALDVPLPSVVDALGQAQPPGLRMQLEHSSSGAVILNDSYNANPASTEAALRSLAALDATRRVAVLGPMLELGSLSGAEHARIGRLAVDLGIDRVVAVDAPQYGVGEAVDDVAAALVALGPLAPRDAVLVKGSRAAGLDLLAAALVEPSADRAGAGAA
jgi:UDP-N-acetylmuramoyl-tripeptide--D-alanyl-D-alanine ligase